ncbi:C45 family autoproteolytic acyltransferase/hydrolase [Chloroflexota bacterium]
MREITLKGTFYEIGKQFGQACKKNIKTFTKMAYLMASLAKKPGSQPFNPNLWYFIPTYFTYKKEITKWQALAKEYEKEIIEYHPDAIEFMKGIAVGADIPYIDVLSLNISTENIITCSLWGASGKSTVNDEPIIAMNADEEPATQKYETFLDISPDKGYRYKVTAFSGWVGYNHGMNETGLAVASSLLWTKPAEEKRTRPPMLILMKVINTCSSVEQVKEFFESVPNHALGTVFYIADNKKIMRVECTPEKRVYEIVENGSLGTTNILMSEELQKYDGITLLKQTLNAENRRKRMIGLLEKYEGKIDKDIMHLIASDHGEKGTDTYMKSICQHPKGLRYNFKTLVSFIAQPKKKCFWIYEGNPCKNKVKKYTFN